jgi:hypothetical protein
MQGEETTTNDGSQNVNSAADLIAQISEQLDMPNLKLVSQEEFLTTLEDDDNDKLVVDSDGTVTRVTNQQVKDMCHTSPKPNERS